MSDVFISYGRADRTSAHRLARRLEDQGWSVWWDREIPSGELYDDVIEAAIAAASCVVVLWSEDSVKSRWVRTEAEEGATREVLVPALLDDVSIPLSFRRIQAARLVGWDGTEADAGFQQLLGDISRMLGTAVEPMQEPNGVSAKPEERLGRRVSHFELESVLGAGGMGRVYLAHDTRLGRPVALKFLAHSLTQDPDARARFLREARSASLLDHPNIGTIFETGEHQGELFIAMAYYKGKTLRDRLQQGPIELEETLSVLRQIADGLAAAHEEGIVHRDIKPANVMLTPAGHVKVLDFGLAKPDTRTEDSDTGLTLTGTTLGTVAYMSPEQARGDPVDHRSDLWSLGVVAYEMLAGRQPFGAPETVATLSRILTEEPPPLDDLPLPQAVRTLVGRLLDKEATDRPQSAAEVAQVLAAVEGGADASTVARPVLAPELPDAGPQQARKPSRPVLASRRLVVVGAVLAVAAITLTAFLLWPSSSGPTPARNTASLVTLPCQVFGPEESAFLADAVPSTLTTALTQIEGLEPRLPPTSLQVDPSRPDMQRLADAYGVEICLTCSILAEANQLVLNFQAVEPESQRLLWSRQFEGRRDEYIAVLREVADGVRLALLPESTPIPETVMSAARSEAEVAFQRGRYYSNLYNNRKNVEDFDTALEAFERSLELDPELADAETEIGFLYILRSESDLPLPEALVQVAARAERALALDPDCAGAWELRAFEQMMSSEGSRLALEYALRAARLDPSRGLFYVGLVWALPSTTLALEAALEGARVDPFYLYTKINAASIYHGLSSDAEALPLVDEILESEPDMPIAVLLHVHVLLGHGRNDEASLVFDRLAGMYENGMVEEHWFLSAALAMAFESEDAEKQQALETRVLELATDPQVPPGYVTNLAQWNAPLLIRNDKTDSALRLLLAGGRAGALEYDWLLLSPDFEPVRETPEFAELLNLARPTFEEALDVLEEARSQGELPEFMEQPLADLKERVGI